MRKEGIKRQDFGCCPGHDKFPNHTYNTRASKNNRETILCGSMYLLIGEAVYTQIYYAFFLLYVFI